MTTFLDKMKRRLERAKLFASVARSTGILQPIRPAALLRFARDMRKTKVGPHAAVMFHAAAHPDREALVEYDGDGSVRRMTWGELDATINRLANALVARGIGGGARVALMLPNGAEYLIAQQALARLGATAVQIGYRSKAAEVAYILDNATPAATLVHAEFLPVIHEARALTSDKGGPILAVGASSDPAIDWDRALAAASPEMPVIPASAHDDDGAGVIVYTSGTTGKPKGATRSYKKTGFDSVADMIAQVDMRATDRHLVVCPLYHSAAPAFVAITMALGASIVLMNHFDPEEALAIIARERVTCSMMVPTMLIRIAALPAETIAKYDTRSLRWIMSGAAPLTTEAARRFMARFGPILWNFYGATETGLVTLARPEDHLKHPGTIGRAMVGNAIRLVGDTGAEVPTGEIGELYARNSTLISGYHGNADATNQAQRDGFFSVGDLGRVDADGFYYLESRKHDMVISGGVNIYPREIEDHLSTHPAILEVAVVGVPDAEWGETLRAFVVARPGRQISEVEVQDYCRKELADYKRPRKVTFLAELPRNPTGKILKRELKDLA